MDDAKSAISQKEKDWRRANNRCMLCRSPDHELSACPRKKENVIGGNHVVRGTALEELKDSSA